MCHRLGLTPFQSALHRALHDAVNFIPAEVQLLGYRFLAGGLEPGNGQGFKQGGEARARFRPGQRHHLHSVLWASRSRRAGVQNGLILAGVQMPPAPFRLMIIQGTGRGTFRAGPALLGGMLQIDMDLARFQFQFDPLHLPRSLNAQNATIEFTILHTRIVACCGAAGIRRR